MSPSPADRLRENLTGVVSTVVTGVWLAAMFTGQDWWLAALLFGYVVVVPLTAVLFGDEDDREEWWDDDADATTVDADHAEVDPADAARGDADETAPGDALDTLRERYARGELTDEQFERKLERLLESESLEDVEDRVERGGGGVEHSSRGVERE